MLFWDPVPPEPLNIPCHSIHFGLGPNLDPIVSYLKSIGPICPFIEPAERAGCLFASQVTIDCRTSAEIHPRMFEQLVPAVERFRDRRRAMLDKSHRLLLCDTVVFHIPAEFDAEANRLMAWPNWLGFLLKDLYTSKAIVFGFIRKGVSERSSTEASIPASPFHAVVIRSKIIGADHRFFAGNEALLSALAEGVDDGADVHAGLVRQVPDVHDPAAIRASGYFQQLRALGQNKLMNKPR